MLILPISLDIDNKIGARASLLAYIDNLYKQGFEALSLGLPERAIPLFEKVLAIDNKNPDAMVGH